MPLLIGDDPRGVENDVRIPLEANERTGAFEYVSSPELNVVMNCASPAISTFVRAIITSAVSTTGHEIGRDSGGNFGIAALGC